MYVCTSEPVPNESFPGSSTSGHSSTQAGTGSMCLCVCTCWCECMTEMQTNSVCFHPVVCFVQKVWMTICYCDSQRTNQCQSTNLLQHSIKILTWWRLIPAWTAPPHHAKSQLSVSASYQTLKFRWNPMLPFRNWKRYTPTRWVSFPGRWIVNDLCCHAVWLCKNHNPWREGDTHTHPQAHTNVDTNTPRSWCWEWDGLVGSGGSHAAFPLSWYDNPSAHHATPICTCSHTHTHTHIKREKQRVQSHNNPSVRRWEAMNNVDWGEGHCCQ